ncbi:ester cyclase [Pseudonocardia dioxanivorans]|uniref:ester cyclase n=1 Tax=Pseudonocardia dioxanivorans TaxID=240495 RepID=UPI000CD18BD8|nr:ester cyclase [Pseudonocardia dioxanivorans]
MVADAGAVVAAFLSAVADHDLDGAFALVADDADVRLPAAGVNGDAAAARGFLHATLTAFPDLTVRARRTVVAGDGTVVVELTLEGTQAGDYLGVVNQEKHLDVDEGWLFRVRDGRITAIHGYWCQNQVYRRLAVRRLDQPAIV